MEKVLNQEEIDALFQRARGQKGGAAAQKRHVMPCDFRSAGDVTKDQLRLINALHATIARNLTHALGAYLRVGLEMAVVSVEQLNFGEFLQRVPDLTYFASFKMNELDAVGAIHIELPIVYPVLDLLLGGRGRPEAKLREMTEIEQEILASIVRTIVRELNSGWHETGLSFTLEERRSNEEMAEIITQGERVLAISFEMRLPEVQAMLNVVFPIAVSNVMQRNLQKLAGRRHPSAPAREQLRQKMMNAHFGAELSIADAQVPAKQLLDIEPGTVLTVSHKVQEPIALKVAGTPLFVAFPVARNNMRAGYIQGAAATERSSGAEHVTK